MAPADSLSPPGSSTYQSNTLYVGDGTWDSSKNDFLLPNLVGLNFKTMQYNGMGNRFSTFPDYHNLIKGHAICAVIVFLFLLPFSIMFARFRTRDPGSGVRFHIYLNILSLFLSTVVFILGWFAVGPKRSLTNPHHGIGLAIYVLILIQTMGGSWVRGKLRKHNYRRLPIKLMLHQWLGRTIALLGIVQVALGLTLYGSPKWTFVLYTLWMTFLLLLYFIFTYRAGGDVDHGRYSGGGGGTTVITEEKKSGGLMKYLAPLAAGGAIAALLSRRKSNKERDRSRSRSRSRVAEVLPSRRGSRRGSESFIEEEKYSEDHRKEGGGVMGKLLGAGAVLGAGALAKTWWERRNPRRVADEEYSAVAPDTPNRLRRNRGRGDESVLSDETVEVRRTDHGHGGILPGPGDPLVTAAAIGAASHGRPRTPAPIGRPVGGSRRDSGSSMTHSSYDSRPSPSRRESTKNHTVRNTVLAGIGLGWLGKKFADRRDKKEQDRLDEIKEREREDERRFESERRHGNTPSKFTADGRPPRNSRRPTDLSESSDMSSDVTDSRVEPRRGTMPPLAAGGLAAGGLAGAAMAQSRSRHDVIEPVPMPTVEPRRSDFHESGSEAYNSSGGRQHRRHSSGRGRAAEVAAAGAAGAGLALAAEEVERRRRERSRASQGLASPPVSVKVQMHGDKNRNVTLRRLTEEEAAAERDSRRRRRADSASSLSGAESATNNRYRREASSRRDAERRAEAGVAGPSTPLSPPRPAFAGGRQPKDSSYYSGPPAAAGSFGSPESHGTWSGLSPSGTAKTGEAELEPAERRRRRRLERNQRMAAGTVDYT